VAGITIVAVTEAVVVVMTGVKIFGKIDEPIARWSGARIDRWTVERIVGKIGSLTDVKIVEKITDQTRVGS